MLINITKKYFYIFAYFTCIYAETDESKTIVSYIQAHIKTATIPLPEKIKNRAADIVLLEDFVKNKTISLDNIPDTILTHCKDLVFRDALFALISALRIKIVSDDKTIESIIEKLNAQDVYSYFSAKIERALGNSDAFTLTMKSASQQVKDFVLLDVLLTTASEFGTVTDYQKSDAFRNNENVIKLAIAAGGKINELITQLEKLSLPAAQKEAFIMALFAPHADFIDFLIKNGLDKNLTLPTGAGQKKQTLVQFYEDQLKNITEKLTHIASTDLKKTEDECKKIIALIKPTETKTPASPPAAAAETTKAVQASQEKSVTPTQAI